MRILIAGAGAIGGLLAAKIVGHDVTLLGRQALADAVAAEGLQVRGLSEATTRPRVITEPAGEYDLIFLTCKAHQTADLVPRLVPSLAPVGVFASLQNGLGNGEKIAAHVPAEKIVVCLTSHGVTVESPGKLVHAGLGATKVGPLPGTTSGPAVEAVHAVLAAAGMNPELCPEMRGQIWLKAIINAGLNPVAALHGVANGGLLAEPLWSVARQLALEAESVAKAARVKLPGVDVVETLAKVCEATASNRCSMLQDVRNRKPTEIEQITGAVLRTGVKLGLDLPASKKIYGELKVLEESYLGERASAMADAEARLSLQV